jgi:hypothetical protein
MCFRISLIILKCQDVFLFLLNIFADRIVLSFKQCLKYIYIYILNTRFNAMNLKKLVLYTFFLEFRNWYYFCKIINL